MNCKLSAARVTLLLVVCTPFLLYRQATRQSKLNFVFPSSFKISALPPAEEENEEFTEERMAHEYKMLSNPVTGKIPAHIRELELEAVRNIPSREANSALWRGGSILAQNTYESVGPNNVGGRSRTLAFDKRNPNIMITGGVTGGIFRSTDGGNNWTFVSGENDIHSATTIAQDPFNPDTWYCGTGEAFYPISSQDVSNGTFGFGIFKSTNNGVSWSKLSFTVSNNNENQLDNAFDLVHRIAVHPLNGNVYAAVHRRIMRSTDGGQSWQAVLEGPSPTTASGGITDVIIGSNGSKIYAAISGANPDRSLAGVWESTSGDVGSWKRIAGGASGQTDSIAGWQAYPNWERIVLALNSANTKLFMLYQNGKSASDAVPVPEADLFRADVSSGNPNTYTWTNLNNYVPDEPNYNEAGIDPYTTQFSGFNMSINVKPDNDNILFIGGSVLERVNLAQTDPALKFRRVGGYGKGFFPSGNFIYPNHHPDIHGIYFPPGSNDVMFTADDGGIHKTTNSTMADTVTWTPLNTNLQTMQYQFVNIQQDTEADFIIGGAQDNGTYINLNPGTALDHIQLSGGDGAAVSITQFFKTGNTWKQYWYMSVVQGAIYRSNLTWQASGNTIDLTDYNQNEITPTGEKDNGQWLTLFVNDPDSTQHLYYNNKNKLYRTKTASTVTSSSWTEMTGVNNTIPSGEDFSAMAISKSRNGTKYLYFGTIAGKVYRLNNPNTSTTTAPVSITPTTMLQGSYIAGISVNPRNPDTVLAVVSNYDGVNSSGQQVTVNNIFWTGNATSANPTWQVIDGALGKVSSQSCAIVVKSTGVEYYVGTSVGLYSTTTIAGSSTQWFNEGTGMIKRAIVRSLVNRQKDNTLLVGTHGNGAFVASIGDAVVLENNVITGINDPVTNDKNFIRLVYPTFSSDEVFFKTGNMYTIKTISVELFSMNGQKISQAQQAYQSGSVKLGNLSKGNYILQITSSDGKFRHVQKISRN
jgi:hypothetical protein